MQLKRVLVSLLVVAMILSVSVVAISADDMLLSTGTSSLNIAVGAPTASEEGIISAKPGDTIELNVTITNNPGVAMLQYTLKYDANVLAPVVDADGKVVFESGIFTYTDKGVDTSVPGTIRITSDLNNRADVADTGVAFKVSFKVAESFDGNTTIEIVGDNAFNGKLDKVEINKIALVASVHTFVAAETVAPTCTAEGYTVYKCACGETYNGDKVEAAGHTYVETVVAPTCTAEGYTLNKCSVCGDEQKSDNVAALGHTEEVIAAVPGTCLANGTSEGKKCSVCGEILVAVTETTKGDHVLETYSEDGMTDGQKCSVCGEIVVPGEPISGSLLWLWIVIAVVVVAGAAAVVFFVVKKKK